MEDKEFVVTAGSGYDLTRSLFIELVGHLAKQKLLDLPQLSRHLIAAAEDWRGPDKDPAVAAALQAIGDTIMDFAPLFDEQNPPPAGEVPPMT